MQAARGFSLRNRIRNLIFAAAAAQPKAIGQSREGAVFAGAIQERREEGPAAARKRARIQEIGSYRTENERGDEKPKAAVIAKAAIHSFSSFKKPQSMYFVWFCGLYHILCSHARKMFEGPFI